MEKLYSGYGLDHNGYIISDVIDVYMPSIQESIERLKSLFPHNCIMFMYKAV